MFRTFIWCVCNSNSNQPLSKYVTLQAKLGHDRIYHTPSDHSNQPMSKYVTLQSKSGHDRRYHTPSESDDQTIVTHHTRSIVTHYALAL